MPLVTSRSLPVLRSSNTAKNLTKVTRNRVPRESGSGCSQSGVSTRSSCSQVPRNDINNDYHHIRISSTSSVRSASSTASTIKGGSLVIQMVRLLQPMLLIGWIMLSLMTIRHFHDDTEYGDGSLNEGSQSQTRLRQVTHVEVKSPNSMFSSSLPQHSSPIPQPLPSNKVSIVLMNHSRPRMIRESSLMRTLLAHPNVGEVLLLHSNPNTQFELVHEKVTNIDASGENDEIGLGLRFYFCQTARYGWVIHVDDDMEFDLGTLSDLIIEFSKNPQRIVGRFGRSLDFNFDFMYNGYSSVDTSRQTEVILTKLMIMERSTCGAFFEYADTIWEDIILNEGVGPLWNGEDIFMSLVANHKYGSNANNYAMDWLDVRDAPESLKDYTDGRFDVSGGLPKHALRFWDWKWWQSVARRNRHYAYRGKLWQTAKERLALLDY